MLTVFSCFKLTEKKKQKRSSEQKVRIVNPAGQGREFQVLKHLILYF